MLSRGRRFRLRSYVGAGSLVSLGAAAGLLGTGVSPTPRSIDQTAAAASGMGPSSSRTSMTVNAPVSGRSTSPRGSLTGLDDRQALRATRRAFKAFIDAKGWADLQDQPRLKVKRYVGERAAVIDTAGKRVLVTSLLPLRSGTGKAKRPIDTQLGMDQGRLRPAQPLSEFSLAPKAASGSLIDFPNSDVKVTLDGARDAPGIRSGESLVYPNSFPDADAILKSLPSSVGFAVSVRSPRAPESYPVSLTLRPGDRLLATGPRARGALRGPTGGAVVLRSGRAVSTITAPVAVDAAGTTLPVTTRISGDRLVYNLAHRNQKTVYPALLDPFVSEDQRYWFGVPPGTAPPSPNPIPDFNGWAYSVTGVGGLAGAQGNGAFGNGLNIFASSGLTYPPSGTIGTWTFQAPFNPAFEADGARIIKADFGYTAHVRSQGATSTMLQSIYNRQGARTENGFVRGSDPNTPFSSYIPYPNTLFGFSQAASEGIAGNKATYPYRVHCLSHCNVAQPAGNEGLGSPGNQVRLGMLQNGGRPSVAGGVFMGSSLIMMTEQAAPRITTSGAPSAAMWTNAPFTISATVNDYGLGPDRSSITAPNNTAPLPTTTQGGACTAGAGPPAGGTPGSANKGDRNHRCTAPLSLQAPSSSLADGSYNVTVNATDILGTSGSATVPVKLDREGPMIEVTGALVEGLNGFVGDSASATVTARDQLSGTRSLGVTIDGVAQGPAQACSTDGCTITRPVSITPGQLEDGEHTLEVTATDGAGNPRTFTRTFRQDTEAPTTAIGGAEWESDGELFSDDTGDVVVETDDVLDDSITPGGIRSVEVLVDGQRRAFEDKLSTCQAPGGCPAQADSTLTIDNRALGDGTHTITVRTRDAAGNEDVQESSIELVHQTPKPPQSIDVSSVAELTIRGTAGDGTGEASATAGDVDGDGEEDYVVGSPSQGTTGAAHIVFGTSETADVTLGSDARDGSGKLRSLQLTGAQASDRAGAAVAAAGDVNGDGFMDVVVGAPGTVTVAALASGRVHVVFGGPGLRTGAAALSLGALAANGFTVLGRSHVVSDLSLIGLDKPSTFGAQLATRRLGDFAVDGDVNGDGLDDIVIGDASQSTGLLGLSLGAGVAYVIFGKADASTIDLNASAGDPGAGGFRIYGAALRGALGQGSTIIGDVDGDDRGDLLVTAPGEQSPNGAAYVIYGRTGGDVNTDNLGGGGYRIAGAAGDRLSSAASTGDVNGDSIPDLLLGGRGATVVYGKGPVGDIDLSGPFDGYRITAPADTTPYQSAAVTGVGDQDGDDVPDAVVGFPAANGGAGEAYVVYGRPTPRQINLATMGGDEGAKLTGGGAATGASALGADDGPDGYARYGTASPGNSMLRISSGFTLAAAPPPNTGQFGCQKKAEWRFFYISRTRPTPRCRRGQSGALDHPLFTRRVRSVKAKAQVRCRQLGSVDCVPIAPGAGTARIPVTRRLKSGTIFRLRDSYTNAFLAVEQTAANCFRVSRLDNAGNPTGTPVDTNPSSTGCSDRSGNRFQFRVRIELQGRACMQPASLQSDYYLIRLVLDTGTGQSTPRRRPNPNTGRADRNDFPRLVGLETGPPDPLRRDLVQGFVARDAIVGRGGGLRDLISARARDRADDASSGCGRKPTDKRLRGSGAGVSLADVPKFGMDSAGLPVSETYQSRFAISPASCNNLRSTSCGAPYSNYQGTSLAPSVIAIVANTVGVTGDSTANNPTGQTGIVRAILPRSGSFRRLDFTGLQPAAGQPLKGYVDPNVPCGRSRPATWWYGYVQSPGTGNDVNRRIYGWVAARVPSPMGPDPTSTPNMQPRPPGDPPCIP